MSTARLFLSGIKADGHHGARPGEKATAQQFVVDLDLEVELGTDTIDGTADYRAITQAVRSVVQDGSFDLIESLSTAIADHVLGMDRIVRVTAVVHKPNAAERLGIEGVAAAVTVPEG